MSNQSSEQIKIALSELDKKLKDLEEKKPRRWRSTRKNLIRRHSALRSWLDRKPVSKVVQKPASERFQNVPYHDPFKPANVKGARDSVPPVLFSVNQKQFVSTEGLRHGKKRKPEMDISHGVNLTPQKLSEIVSVATDGKVTASVAYDQRKVVIESPDGRKSVYIDRKVKLPSEKLPSENTKPQWTYNSILLSALCACFLGVNDTDRAAAFLNSRPVNFEREAELRKTVILPVVEELATDAFVRACADYRRRYLLLHPDHPPHRAIPAVLSSDGRWQKRWGWNSLDGHTIAHLHPLPQDEQDGMNLSMHCCGVFSFHRLSPSEEGGDVDFEIHVGSAGSMDPAGIKKTVEFVMSHGIDPCFFLHDNDAKGYTAAVDAKEENRHRLDLEFSDGMKELLCLRHGALHAGKDMVKFARDSLSGTDLKINSKQYHWIASAKCQRYISKMFRLIMKNAHSAEEAIQSMKDLVEHLKGNHNSSFCRSYGRCYDRSHSTRPDIINPAHRAVLEDWLSRWSKEAVVIKYMGAYDTNIEEACNSIMIMFLEKKKFSRTMYDIAAFSCGLFKNLKGWNFLNEVTAALDIQSPFLQAQIRKWEKYAKKQHLQKNSEKQRQRRSNLKRLRVFQNANARTTHNEVVKHGRARTRERQCRRCGSTDHVRSTRNNCPQHPEYIGHM